MKKRLTAYEIYKTICKTLETELTCVKCEYDRAVYHKGHKDGYYLININTASEGSVIATYDIMYHHDVESWFDVNSGLITMRDNPIQIANEILSDTSEPFDVSFEPGSLECITEEQMLSEIDVIRNECDVFQIGGICTEKNCAHCINHSGFCPIDEDE